ncbi:MAG: N-methylhydantoinase [Solirubrobacteraceae bacterium]|nr:N-methylhydantoinase [Solirubrobacteraceae bacterium]
MAWRIAVDTGGTFTDVVALDGATGAELVFKTPSTPDDPSRAFEEGIRGVLEQMDGDAADVDMVLHGSTVATNAILEAKYSRMGLIVTRGYQHMLEVARQNVPGVFGAITYWIKPPRVVPLELVREVGGRIDHQGAEIEPVDEAGVRRIAAEYRQMGIEAIAVSLMHSYRDPAHERRVGELILDEHPDCFVSLSSDVIREYREYERTLSTCLNTGLMPLLSRYVGRLQDRSGDLGVDAPLRIMKSSGGVARASELIERPIAAALSGPAAGVIAAAALAAEDGYTDVLTLDMGGTSADIALIENGTPRLLSEGKVDIYDIKSPMVDLTTVGAGGGSIAWLGASGALRVGPESAGSTPGPACYGKGGESPTVTDANLVLGRISPYLLGGTIQLDRDAAEQAIRTKIAEPMGLSVLEAASGILRIAVHNMALGVRLVSVQRGRDPRGYVLVPFGGAGGLHAALVAEELGIRRILLPVSPGATSAEGLLQSDVRVDHVITHVMRQDRVELPVLNAATSDLRDRAADELRDEGFEGDGVTLEWFFDMRYAGQAYEIRVPVALPGDGLSAEIVGTAVEDFHRLHERNYGYAYEGESQVELVNVGITGFGRLARPAGTPGEADERGWEQLRKATRPVVVTQGAEPVDCGVYDRPLGALAEPLAGPAIVEQYDSTVVVEDGWQATALGTGHLVLDRVA